MSQTVYDPGNAFGANPNELAGAAPASTSPGPGAPGRVYDPGGAFGEGPTELEGAAPSVGTPGTLTPGAVTSLHLVAATEDANSQAVLTFQWPAFLPISGPSLRSYTATLWSDAGRTQTIAGGATQSVTSPSATFGGIPRGVPFLLDVTAIDTSGAAGPTLSLLQTSPAGYAEGQTAGLTPDVVDYALGEAGEDVEGVVAPIRAVYGTVDGVKRWARPLTFGDGKGQVSALDVLYFLMVASDDADGEFAQRYAVPLTKYRDAATGLFRYPPPLPGLIERKAAGLLLYARKAILSEAESGTAVGLMTYADRRITDIAANDYLLGQTLMAGVLPKVYNPVPRQFSMPGDPEGMKFNCVVGSTDTRFTRPHGLAYVGVSWRGGMGYTLIDDVY